MKKRFKSGVALLGALSIVLAACGGDDDDAAPATTAASGGETTETTEAPAPSGDGKVGFILPDSASSARWESFDRPLIEAECEAAGLDCVIQNAEGDADNMATIADQMIADGVKVLAIVNLDSDSGAAIQEKAAAAGVKNIDYDRLTLGGSADVYVSFDNVAVGTAQGEGIIECMGGAGNVEGKKIIQLHGSPTDNNATLFKQGYQAAIEGSGIETVGEEAVPDWDNAQGGVIFEQLLTAAGGEIDGVLVANDGLSLAAQAVLADAGLTVPTTGQDATVEGLRAILQGTQCMTVYKPVVEEAKGAVAAAAQLLAGEEVTANATIDNGNGEIPYVQAAVQSIFIDQVKDVIADGFVSEADVCAGIEDLCAENGIGEGGGAEPTSNGELEGMKGTTPKSADVSAWVPAVDEFWQGLGNDALTDFNYAAESYDAVIVTALAAAKAGTDGSAHAAEVVGITRDGEKCTTFADCLAIIEAGGDPDYDGVSGPHEFNGNGEPLKGSYAVLTFGADNRISPDEVLIDAEAPESSIVDLVPVSVEREGDGVLTIGSFLPETGNLAFLGAPTFAGVEFAIAEINAAGGVLGQEIVYVQGDSGDLDNGVGPTTISRLLGENVDIIIGAASSSVTLSVIDTVVSAGVTMFSPSNTSPALSDYDDKGLYFRNAPADGLQGAIVANLIVEDGNASAYILNLNDAYGNGIAAVVQSVLEASGVEVLGAVAYDAAAASFDAEVDAVVDADPDAVVLISFDEGSRILRSAVEKGIGPTVKNWYGTDGNMGNALGENFDAGN